MTLPRTVRPPSAHLIGHGLLRAGCGIVIAAALVMSAAQVTASASPKRHSVASVGPGLGADASSPATVADALRCAKPAHRVHVKRKRAIVAVAVGMAESYCEKKAAAHDPPTSGCPNGSVDRGLWQINSCYHSEVSDRCAYRAKCNARAAKRISDHGKDWTPWSAYNSGAYRQYLAVARLAVHQAWSARQPQRDSSGAGVFNAGA